MPRREGSKSSNPLFVNPSLDHLSRDESAPQNSSSNKFLNPVEQVGAGSTTLLFPTFNANADTSSTSSSNIHRNGDLLPEIEEIVNKNDVGRSDSSSFYRASKDVGNSSPMEGKKHDTPKTVVVRQWSGDIPSSSQSTLLHSKPTVFRGLNANKNFQNVSVAAIAAGTAPILRSRPPSMDYYGEMENKKELSKITLSQTKKHSCPNLEIKTIPSKETPFEVANSESDEESPALSPSPSFRTLALKAVEEKTKNERWRNLVANSWLALKSSVLFLFISFLFVCAFVESLRNGKSGCFLVLLISIVVYTSTIIPVWLLLLVYIYKGKLYRQCVNRFCSRSIVHYSTLSISSHSPMEPPSLQGQPQKIEVGESEVPKPLSTPLSSFPSLRVQPQNDRRPLTEKRSSKKVSFGGRNNNFARPLPQRSTIGEQKNRNEKGDNGRMNTYGDGTVKKMNSDADLVFFYWSSQKQKMRQNQLQTGALRSQGSEIGFNVRSANTTGQIRAPPLAAPRCLKCRAHLDPLSRKLFCDVCQPNEASMPALPSPTLHRVPALHKDSQNPLERCSREWQTIRSFFKNHDFGHRYLPVQPVDDEAEIRRLAEYRATQRKRQKRWYHLFSNLQQCRKWMISPLRASMAIHDFPPFQISLLLRNFAWCGLYLWTTTLVKRETSDDHWDTSGFPKVYFMWEDVFMWMITWDYCVLLLAAQDQLRFVFSVGSIVDLLTMPTAKFFARLHSVEAATEYSIYFGSLRILRLARVEGILSLVVPWISQVKLRLVSLAIGAVVITLIFACAMFVLEAPYAHRPGFDTVYGFMFFAVVTISTVGYGDFAPTKNVSKAIVMVAIVAALTFLPSQVQKLIAALQTPPKIIGKIPGQQYDYIVISGPVTPRQLLLVCRELALSLPGSCNHILVVTPDQVVPYTNVIRSAFLKGRIRITAVQGIFFPTKLRGYYRHSRAVFIVGNVCQSPNKDFNQRSARDPEAIQLQDDHQTLLRFLGAQHICWPDRPICVQLYDGTNKNLVTEMGAYHVVSLQHMKMKLMAKSCSGCPGFITLITNLFHQPLSELEGPLSQSLLEDSGSYSEAKNLHRYFGGSGYQLYRLEFPECFYEFPVILFLLLVYCHVGLQYTLLVRILLVQYQVYLIGVSCVSKEYWLNPVGYHIGDELENFTDWPFAGIIAAASLHVVQKITQLRRFNIPQDVIINEESALKRKQRGRGHCLKRYFDCIQNITALTPVMVIPDCSLSSSASLESQQQHQVMFANHEAAENLLHQPLSQLEMQETPLGIKQVLDIDIAMKHVFKEPDMPLIIICGWPRGIHIFLATVQCSLKANVIILSPCYPLGLSGDIFSEFVDICAWVEGSATDDSDLLRAGILQAQSCAVFSTPQVSWQNTSPDQTDTQAILVREFIYAMYHSDTLLNKRLTRLTRRTTTSKPSDVDQSANPFDDAPIASGNQTVTLAAEAVNSSLMMTKQKSVPLVIVELKDNRNIEYLDVTPLQEDISWSTKLDFDDMWMQEGLYVRNPEFASGRVLLEEMLHGMISFSLPISRFCMDTRVIDHFVEGSYIPLPEGFLGKPPIWLEPIPISHEKSRFGAFVNWLLREEQKLAFGIYRKTKKMSAKRTPIDLFQGEDLNQYVVISCPPIEMELQPGDHVYVIHPCPPEALGLLFSSSSHSPR